MNILNKPIEIVTETFPDGKINPIRFRVKDSEEEWRTIHIKRVIYTNEYKVGNTKELIRKFICEIEINDSRRQCEIEFNLNTMKWTLVKM